MSAHLRPALDDTAEVDRRTAVPAGRPLTVELQVSINQALMRRLDALEREVRDLRRQVKDINYREPV